MTMRQESREPHRKRLAEIKNQVIELSRSGAIFWGLMSKANFKRYSKVEEEYGDFFGQIADTLAQGFFVIAYRLFDKRRGTVSLWSLVQEVGLSDMALAEKLKKVIVKHEPLLKKVSSIRGNVYAHRNEGVAPEEVFKREGLSFKDMKEIVKLAGCLISKLADATKVAKKRDVEKEVRLRWKYAYEDTREIMRILQRSV